MLLAPGLEGKVAFVSGGSRGIGRATCLALAASGCRVALSYVSKEAEAMHVVAEIEATGHQALALPLDVSREADCDAAFERIEATFGAVDILVNNAGIVRDNLTLMLEAEDWRRVLDVNLMGAVHCSKLATKQMMAKRWGRIINISSVAATKGGRGQANYAASKGALEAFSRSLAVEIGGRNITVNCIAPGIVGTDMSEEIRRLAPEEIEKRQVIKGVARAEEIAPWVVMLASEYGRFVTGQTFHIDGGFKLP